MLPQLDLNLNQGQDKSKIQKGFSIKLDDISSPYRQVNLHFF